MERPFCEKKGVENMRLVKSFNHVFSVVKSLYFSFGSISFKFSFVFIGFFLAAEVFMLTMGRSIPLFRFDNPLVRYLVIPYLLAWVMDKKTFDDKKPYSFLRTFLVYLCKRKYTYAGRAVKTREWNLQERVTTIQTLESYDRENVKKTRKKDENNLKKIQTIQRRYEKKMRKAQGKTKKGEIDV